MLPVLRRNLALLLAEELSLTAEKIELSLEIPKKLEHGHLAFPVFPLAREFRKAPPLIAKELAEKFRDAAKDQIESVNPVGGYLNFVFKDALLQSSLMDSIKQQGDRLGYSDSGKGKKVVIDYSSPNVAKPMHVGHLRATMIGQAIRNLAVTQGYEVIGLNHLGDWGVQFGNLAWAYQHWRDEYDMANRPFDSLFKMYVRFHQEAEKNPELAKQGSLIFKRLEEGDKDIEVIWQEFIDITLREDQKIWDRLGVKHDLVRGESFYNDRLKDTENRLQKLGLLVESRGAMVVQLEEHELPPCLIRKTDGASLYATRDIASAIYRFEELKADQNLYLVGVDQSLHFQQVFLVLEKMGYKDWKENSHHVAFGMYRFKDAKFSTRKGNVIFLEEVLDRAVELAANIITKKNPDLKNKDEVVEQVGIGAIVFFDLIRESVRDVDIDWDKLLDFDGDSGPYLQYMAVRCNSILNKYGGKVSGRIKKDLSSDAERQLIRRLLEYPDILSNSYRTFRPNILAQYALDVCRDFSQFYHKCRVLGEPAEVEESRVNLVWATHKILSAAMGVMNIPVPKAM